MSIQRRLELAWSELEGRSCLRVSGWNEADFEELVQSAPSELGSRLVVLPSEVAAAGIAPKAMQSMAGSFEFDQGAVCFVPRFPFLQGLSYSLIVRQVSGDCDPDSMEAWAIHRPLPECPLTAVVEGIYPSALSLPVNQLKLYIHFSHPMSEGWSNRAVYIRRADNDEPLEEVFLAMEPELWDRERRRLTLLLDPGRIKRGLIPNNELGYPLTEGVPVIVTVDSRFRDAGGRQLRVSVERYYDVGPPLRLRIDTDSWHYHWPRIGSTGPLIVEFDRPLDRALLEHSLWVNTSSGSAIAGQSYVDVGEESWRFEPHSPWGEGLYTLVVDHRLEDLAGNSLNRVFDRDLMRTEEVPLSADLIGIDFRCMD